LLLLRSDGGDGLDTIGDTSFFFGILIGKDNFGLNLLGLAGENDLAIVF
jgi:hypothetical protein